MQFHLLPVIAVLLAFTQATPVPAKALDTRTNDCGDSTFVNQSSAASPLIKDCQQLARNIAGNGSWTLHNKSQTLATYGTCAFGASSVHSDNRDVINYIGNQDIIDLIGSSIEKFSWSGKVGSKGTMDCSGSGVNWGIYHA